MERDPFTNDPLPAPSRAGDSSSNPAVAPPVEIPDHQLLRKIGSGSYGDVWLARNMMGMYRAVKIVFRKNFDHQRPFERELSGIKKFEPISRSHEGFVDVLHVGMKEQEYFYYVMELGDDQVSGQNIDPEKYVAKTLAKKIAENGKLAFDQCLKLGLGLSDALAELHKHGLVHRDVKPSNIIFVNGAPKLADIGLVASTAEARSYVGTEGFIPPEGPGAPGADVYSLGKVLYEAITGKDRHEFPELPTLLDQFPEQEKFFELNEIILRACRTEAKSRYQTARDLHSDLVVLSNGKSVKRLKMLERRFATLKKIAGISGLALVVASLIAYPIFREHRGYVEARERQIGANAAYGTRALDSGDFLGALPYFAQTIYLKKDAANRNEDCVRFASTLAQCPKLIQLWDSPHRVRLADFDASGDRALIVEWTGARVYDVKTGEPVSPRLGQASGITFGAFSPDGKCVVTSSEDTTAIVWNISDGAELLRLSHPQKVQCAAFSPDGRRIVTACNDNIARVWDARSGKLELSLKGHEKGITLDGILFAAFSHNGKLIATAGRDGTARIWNAANGRQVTRALPHSTWVTSVAFSPDDSQLATGCFDHKAHVWDVATGREIPPAMNHDDAVSQVRFSPDGRFLVTSGLDRVTRFWLESNHQPPDMNPILRDSDRVNSVAVAPDGHRIMTASEDGTVRVWDRAASAVAPESLQGTFSEDGRRFARSSGRTIQVFDTSSNQSAAVSFDCGFVPEKFQFDAAGNFLLLTAPPGEPDAPVQTIKIYSALTGGQQGAAFSISNSFTHFLLGPDGKHLLACGTHFAQMWDAVAGTPLWPPIRCNGNPGLVVFSPAADKLAHWSGNKLYALDAQTGRELFPPLKHEALVKHVEFSPDGSRLLSCCTDDVFTKCSARIWDANTGREIGVPLRHNDGVLFAAFSPDGRRIVTASEDYTAIIWDASTCRQLTPPLKHFDQVCKAVFSPDGKWVATLGRDGTARVWSAGTGEPLTAPLRHLIAPSDVNFLGEGRRVLTRDASGEAWIWNLPADERPAEDLRKLAWLMSSGTIEPVGGSGVIESNSFIAVSRQLREKYPFQFSVAPEEVAAWHDFQARLGEAKNQWQTAVFHLDQLHALRPGDSDVEGRLVRAKKELLAAESGASESIARP